MDFEEYVQARGSQLMRLAFLLTRDRGAAEDLVQSALLDVYRKWPKVQAADSVDAYVRRIVVNTYLGWTRRRSWFERPAPLHSLDVPSPSADPSDRVALADQVRRLLDGLPPRSRTVLVLRFHADLDDDEIANLMGVTPSTVRATASRALAALRTSSELASTKEE